MDIHKTQQNNPSKINISLIPELLKSYPLNAGAAVGYLPLHTVFASTDLIFYDAGFQHSAIQVTNTHQAQNPVLLSIKPFLAYCTAWGKDTTK